VKFLVSKTKKLLSIDTQAVYYSHNYIPPQKKDLSASDCIKETTPQPPGKAMFGPLI